MDEEAAHDEKKPDASESEASASGAASEREKPDKLDKPERPDKPGKPEAAEGPATPAGMPDWLRFPLVLGIVGALSAASLSGIYAITRKQIEASKKVKVTKAFGSVLGGRYAEAEEVGDVKKGGHFVITGGDGALVAYAAQVKCPGSYNAGEPIELIIVLDPKLGQLLGARVVKSAETPGLGERVKEPPSAQSIAGWVAGRDAKKRVVFKKTGGAVVGQVRKKGGSVKVTGPDGETRTFAKGDVEVTEAPFPAEFLDQFTGIPVAKAKLRSAGGRVDAITGATISSTAVTKGVEVAVKLLQEAVKK